MNSVVYVRLSKQDGLYGCCCACGSMVVDSVVDLNPSSVSFSPSLLNQETTNPSTLFKQDVSDILSLHAPELFRTDSNRPNLFYAVRPKPADNAEALKALARFILGSHRGQSGIVYCYSQKEVRGCVSCMCQQVLPALATTDLLVDLDACVCGLSHGMAYTPRTDLDACVCVDSLMAWHTPHALGQSETVAEALNRHNIAAAAYHAGKSVHCACHVASFVWPGHLPLSYRTLPEGQASPIQVP